jgi:hypothetical protein
MAGAVVDPRPRHKKEVQEMHVTIRQMRKDRDEMGKSADDREKRRELNKQILEYEKDFRARIAEETRLFEETRPCVTLPLHS